MDESVIPKLGFGTLYNTDPSECINSIVTALEQGYRHIDTAQMYDNEKYVGRGIEESNVDRDDIFLATKVHQDNLAYDDVLSSTDRSLSRLGINTIDLLYVHWPTEAYDPEETFSAFDKLVSDGKINHVGVSNFTPQLLDEATQFSNEPILANQVEMHPLLQQTELLHYCQNNDLYLVAFSPLAKGEVFNVPTLTDIASKHDITEAQVSLMWLLSKKNVVAIPKSSGGHIRENYKSLSQHLDKNDLQRIDEIEREKRLVDPEFRP